MGRKVTEDTLTIASGQTESGELNFSGHRGHTDEIHVVCQETTLTGTVTVEVSYDSGSSWRTLQSGGANVEVGADDSVVIRARPVWDRLRLVSGSAEGADRDFLVICAEATAE